MNHLFAIVVTAILSVLAVYGYIWENEINKAGFEDSPCDYIVHQLILYIINCSPGGEEMSCQIYAGSFMI